MNKYNEIMENVKVSDEMKKRVLDNAMKEIAAESQKSESIINDKNSGAKIIKFRQFGRIAAALALLVAGFGISSLVLGRFGNNHMETSAPATESAVEYETEATEAAEATDIYEEATFDAEGATDEAMLESAEEAMPDAADTYDKTTLAPSNSVKNDNNRDSKSEDAEMAATQSDDLEMAATESEESDAEGATVEINEYASAEELSKESGIEIADIDSLKDSALEISYVHYYSSDIVEIKYVTEDNEFTYRKSPTRSDFELTGNLPFFESIEEILVNDVTCTLYGYGDKYNQATWSKDGFNYSLYMENGIEKDEFEQICK